MNATRKIKKKVEASMDREVKASAKKQVCEWRLTEVEVMGKIHAMTDNSFTVQGTKRDAIAALGRLGTVISARDLLRADLVDCSYRTVDMLCVENGRERTFWFAERK